MNLNTQASASGLSTQSVATNSPCTRSLKALGTFAMTLTIAACSAGGGGSGDALTAGEDSGAITVTPSTDLASSGTVGGPFSPASIIYTVTNSGTAPVDWSASVNQSWVSLSSTSGSLGVGDSALVTVAIDQGQASVLTPAQYTAQVTLTDVDSGASASREVTLDVQAVTAGESQLSVASPFGFGSTGDVGGPFAPGTKVYTISNTGTASLNWTASADEAWISLSSTGGSIPAGGDFDVTVSINQSLAATLAASTYDGEVAFVDTGNADTERRGVVLMVNAPAGSGSDLTLTPATSLNSSGIQGGPFGPDNQVYTLANTGSSAVTWSASVNQTWISLSSAGGTLAPSTTVDVTVSINQGIASTLPVGGFVGAMTLTDTAASFDFTRTINLNVNPSSGSGSMASSVSQFGITWTFDKSYLVGQFANNDWWVQGPIKIVGISPQSVTNSGRTINGTELNPSPANGMTQGFDSSMYAQYASPGDYSAARNVGLGLSVGSPLNVATSTSVVSTVSVSAADQRPQIATCAILTVTSGAPAAGSFRPTYVGNDKTILFNESQLDYSKLASLTSVPGGGTPNINDVARYFERPWLDHVATWPGRYLHPEQNMQDYGRDLTSEISVGAVVLQMNYTNAQKRDLLVRYVQLGIDFYGITQNGGQNNWTPNEGHSGGRKWPILFAGLMLNDSTMSSIGFDASIDFGEDRQTFFVAETSPGVYNNGFGDYSASDVGVADWGGFHTVNPSKDASGWFTNPYRLCCTSNVWWGVVLAAHVMGAQAAWNHDPLFDYMDRFRSENKSRGITDFRNAWRDFDFEMYDAYRDDY